MGLPANLQSIIRLKNPTSLEIAMQFVTEEQNFRYTQNFATLLSQNNHKITTQINKPNYRSPQFSHTNFKPQMQPTNYLIQPTNQFLTPNNQFPTQPIQLKTKPVNQTFLTNDQVFGKQKNVFQTTGKVPNNPVQPMSTTSKNKQNIYSPDQTNNYESNDSWENNDNEITFNNCHLLTVENIYENYNQFEEQQNYHPQITDENMTLTNNNAQNFQLTDQFYIVT